MQQQGVQHTFWVPSLPSRAHQASCTDVRCSLAAAKKPEDQLFETMDATDLNKTLKDLMDGLSVKVFRTYNASITLDRLLWEPSDSEVIDAKKADYDRANKEVLHSLTLLNSAHLHASFRHTLNAGVQAKHMAWACAVL